MQVLTRKSAGELVALVKSREITPVEILDAHLSVIERLNPKLNAIVTLAADQARAAAIEAGDAVVRGEALGRCTACRSASRTSRRPPASAPPTDRRFTRTMCRTRTPKRCGG